MFATAPIQPARVPIGKERQGQDQSSQPSIYPSSLNNLYCRIYLHDGCFALFALKDETCDTVKRLSGRLPVFLNQASSNAFRDQSFYRPRRSALDQIDFYLTNAINVSPPDHQQTMLHVHISGFFNACSSPTL